MDWELGEKGSSVVRSTEGLLLNIPKGFSLFYCPQVVIDFYQSKGSIWYSSLESEWDHKFELIILNPCRLQ